MAGAVLLVALHFLSFDVATRPLVTDARYYAYFAWQITEGAVPHVDYFDNKTQLASFVGAGLYRLGELLGGDPLLALRAGWLTLAALGGLLIFAIQRRLGRGRPAAGFLGLAAYLAFPILGLLPAVGNVPKLLMVVLAWVAFLCAHDKRWLLAGAASTLAFFDWQIGALAAVAVLVTALVHGRPRGRAAAAAVGGGALAALPFVVYYAVTGGLAAFFDQTVVAALVRGATSAERQTLVERWARVESLVEAVGPAVPSLFHLGLVGVVLALVYLLRGRKPRLLLPLVIFHLGLATFSILDFSRYGDFLGLVPSVAFFLGLVFVGAHELLDRLLVQRGEGARARRLLAVAVVVGALALVRPGPLRPPTEIVGKVAPAGVTLADQRSVAAQVAPRLAGRRGLFLHHAELLFLLRYTQPSPFIYWNRATWAAARADPDEPLDAALARLAGAVGPEVYTLYRRFDRPPLSRTAGLPAARMTALSSSDGRYTVRLRER